MTLDSAPPVVVVIPTYDSRSWVDGCLSSVLAQRGVRLAVAVVDNGSRDGTPEDVSRSWPEVKLIALTRNVGYGEAINVGARVLPAGHVLALNVDVRLEPDALRELVGVLEKNPTVGAVAPRLTNPDGTLQPSAHRFPTLTKLFGEALALDRLPVVGTLFDYHLRRYRYNAARSVDWVSGAVLLVRREAWEALGGFDPQYPFFVEELDLQRRLADQGWRVVLEPATAVVHFGGKRPIAPEVFLQAHAGLERYFGLAGGRSAAAAARAVLCMTALTRAIGWTILSLFDRPNRAEAQRWASMFIRVFWRSTLLLRRIPAAQYPPYVPAEAD